MILQSVANGASSYDNKSDGLVTGTLPNGLAFARNGDILIANFGTDRLEVMSRAGETIRSTENRLERLTLSCATKEIVGKAANV